MTLPRTVADVLADHVTYRAGVHRPDVPEPLPAQARSTPRGGRLLQGPSGHALRLVGALMDPITKDFVAAPSTVSLTSTKASISSTSKRASARTTSPRPTWPTHDGSDAVLFVGRAQEKTRVFRTEKRLNPITGKAYPWLVADTRWSTTSTSTASTTTSARSSSSSRTYFPYTAKLLHQRPRLGQVPGGQGRHRLRGPRQRLRLLRRPGPPPADLRPLQPGQDRRLRAASGWPACPTPSPPPTAGPATATTSPSSRPSSPSPRCSTGPWPDGCSSRRSSVTTSTSGAPTRSSSSSTAG